MKRARRADTLNRVADDCEALRVRLVRTAKALALAEETRAQVLMQAAAQARARAAVDALVHDAEQARDCADMAGVVAARFEQLDPRLNVRWLSAEPPDPSEDSPQGSTAGETSGHRLDDEGGSAQSRA